jgi:DNA-binding CsgD family transcriptional regulator
MRELGRRLRAAEDFVAVASTVCEITRTELQVAQCTVTLYSSEGGPAIVIDNIVGLDDADRLHCFAEHWIGNRVLRELHEHHALVEVKSLGRAARCGCVGVGHDVLLPVVELGSLLGSIRCSQVRTFGADQLRDLSTLATHVSMRLGELGITTSPDPVLGGLTRRQREVALFVAQGCTNREIGEHLAMSENTVKKHLKDIFEKTRTVGIERRAQLANRIKPGPEREAPVGVTRLQGVTITRAALATKRG